MTTKLKKTKRKFKGIVKDAKELGVERTHLYRVLSGQRVSKSLTQRYRSLKEKQKLANRMEVVK